MVLVDTALSISMFFSYGVFVVGMASWLGGGDEAESEESGDDEFAMEDDEFGMDDFEDDFGGMDEMEDSGGASSSELEHRIEDLESEIANVSSTANTVRSENEQISEKVDDVEENVRKLLEIYEMVTRGVNPFVDDVSTGAGMSGDQGSFGLFDSDEEDAADQTDDDLDSDIADAEAEDFFDDDAFDDFDDEFEEDGEDDFDETFDEASEDELDGMEEFDESDGVEDMMDENMDDDLETMDDDSDDSGGGGTSFEELKAEYESGEADWADELEDGDESEDSMEEDHDIEDEPEDDPGDLFIEDDLVDGDDEQGSDAERDTSATDSTETEASEAAGEESFGAEDEEILDDATSETPVAADGAADQEGSESDFQFGAAHVAAAGESPHLERPPDGYLADVVILEWLDFLVDAYDARNAVRAINYYERIGWIGEPMRDHCVEVLLGITDAEYLYRDEFGTTDITMTDHRKSLGYVEELAGGQLDRTFVERLDTLGSNGL